MKRQTISLTMGQEVTLTIGGKSFETRICGWKTNQYLIIDFPAGDEDLAGIPLPAQCHIRYTHQRTDFTFSSRVLHRSTGELSLLFVEYPVRTYVSVLPRLPGENNNGHPVLLSLN